MNNKFLLSDHDEQCFFDFLKKSYGINIHQHQLDNLTEAIQSVCLAYNFSEPGHLLQKIIHDPLCPERIKLIEKITIDESYFFRDDLQIDFLKWNFLPELIEKKRQLGEKNIRIWSAGCSTGQEIYSITILLHQLLPDYDSWNLHLLGTDINHLSLNRSMLAEYSGWNIRTSNDFILNSGYFKPVKEDRYILSDVIKDRVNFSYLNLAEDTFPSIMSGTNSLDIILCRNVFIYFDQDTIQKTCTKFSESLNENGILILSAADPMNMVCADLKKEKSNEIFFFRKKSIPFISVEQDTLTAPFPSKIRFNAPTINLDGEKHSIIKKLSSANWQQALNQLEHVLIDYPGDADLFQFKAKCLINLNKLSEAKTACEKSILYDEVEPHSYLLYGLILLQLGLSVEAEKAFRQTIFLNNSFMEAHYQLGQLLLQRGQKKPAIKSIQNALALAAQEDPDRPIHNVIPLTYSRFSDVMRNELELIKNEASL